MSTYNSSADDHYLNDADWLAAKLPILHPSPKQVAVANGEISHAKHESKLPFPGFSQHASKADTFDNLPQSLMSMSKVSDDGTIFIFKKDGVTVHCEEDVFITCKGEPIHIGKWDNHCCYCIPSTQHKGQWQPRKPSKQASAFLQQANSVYNLPSTKLTSKWMHVICGYPVKSTRLKSKLIILLAGHY